MGTPPIRGRGLRVLALDGGGMRGLALVQILRHIEKRTGESGGTGVACGTRGVRVCPDLLRNLFGALGAVIVNSTLCRPGTPDPNHPNTDVLTCCPLISVLLSCSQGVNLATEPPTTPSPHHHRRPTLLPPGRPLHGLFDLVVGTSTGAIVAVGLGVFHFSLDQCEAIYTGLGHKVFNQVRGGAEPGYIHDSLRRGCSCC